MEIIRNGVKDGIKKPSTIKCRFYEIGWLKKKQKSCLTEEVA